eukprot:744550-Hanusia_phi.AAC.1
MTGPAVDGPSQTVPSATLTVPGPGGRAPGSHGASGFKACHSKPPAGRHRGPADALGPAYRPAARYYRYGHCPSRLPAIIGYGHGSPESADPRRHRPPGTR